MSKTIKFRRGLESARSQIIPAAGEPIFTTDTKKVFIGDGVTRGGIPVGALKVVGVVKSGQLAVFNDDQGEALKAVNISDMLTDYTTKAFIEQRLAQQLTVKVDSAKSADNALKLAGRSDYLTPDIVTSNFNEDSTVKVASARAVQQLYATVQAANTAITNVVGTKLDKSSVVSSVFVASDTSPCSAAAVKLAYETGLTGVQNAASALATAQAAQGTANTGLNTANTAIGAAQAARSAPDLGGERKRYIGYGYGAPAGAAEEGQIYIML